MLKMKRLFLVISTWNPSLFIAEERKVDRVNLEPVDVFLRESPNIFSGKLEMPVRRIAKRIDGRNSQGPGCFQFADVARLKLLRQSKPETVTQV